MSIVAETATLAWGYTMDDLDHITRIVLKSPNAYRLPDASDRWETAWHGIVEHLYDTETTEWPSRLALIRAGEAALREAANEYGSSHGIDMHRDDLKAGGEFGAPNYRKYWRSAAGAAPDFTERLAERLALPQVLSQLTAGQYEALAALAAHGNLTDAAVAVGMSTAGLQKRILTARAKIKELWFAPETPRRALLNDGETCRSGHSRAMYGIKQSNGRTRCRLCDRARNRRYRAQGRYQPELADSDLDEVA